MNRLTLGGWGEGIHRRQLILRTPTRLFRALFVTILVSLAATLFADAPDLPTVDGPETEGLAKELKGLLVYPEGGGILATELPSLEKKTIRHARRGRAISNLSGPDRDGRVAVVASGPRAQVTLGIVRPGKSTARTILRRLVAGARSRALGRPVLSPDGAHVAFVSKTLSRIMKVDPKTHFHEGDLEVWQLDKRRSRPLELKAVDRSLAWLPQGDVLLYSALVGPHTLPDALIGEYSNATGSGVIPVVNRRAPVVHRLELPGGKAVPLCIGRRSIVAHDGKRVLVQGIGFEWMIYDVASRRLESIELPGLHDSDRLGIYEGGVIAYPNDDLVIYWGLPTTGTVQRTTKNNSPLVGPKKMPSIKAARLSSGEFQTLIPFMDPRSEVLFGRLR